MPKDYVLRLRRTDRDGEHLLVNISRHGAKPLNLRLVASEGENVFETAIKESALKSLQNANFHGNLEDWKAILRYALLQECSDDDGAPEDLQGLETVAQISGSMLTITIRRSITGITQRLGSIQLQKSDEEEIDVFGWVHTAVVRGDELQDRLSSLQASASTHQDQLAKLNQQLDDLVKAKKEHEAELLQKFAALLNAKKLKIRDQQRLLNGAKIDPNVAREVHSTRHGGSSRAAASSRKGKRKAENNAEVEPEPHEPAADETEDEDDDDLELRENTPQQSDQDATEDEVSDADGFDAAPAASQRSLRGIGNRGKAIESAKNGRETSHEDDDVLPPRRELPRGKRSSAKVKSKSPEPAPAPAPAAEDEDDDEETDDEL